MTLEQAKKIYEELCDKYEARLAEYAVKYESEIYLENEKLDKVDELNDAGFISLDINVFTDSIDKDSGLCFCASAEVQGLRVDDDEILDDAKEFERTVCEFLDKLSLAGDADELIRSEVKEAQKEADELMRKLEANMKKSTVTVIVAVAVCAIVAAAVLIAHFLA